MSIQKSWIKVFKPEKQFGNDVIKNEGSFDENGTNLDSEVLDYNFEADNANRNDGEKILKDLDKELSDDYHVSAEHKVLFGTLEETKDNSGFPIILRNYATFTALGLEYGEKRIPYKMEFQQEIHEKNFQDFLDKNDDEDDYADLSERIDKENEFWEEPLSEIMVEQLMLLYKRENRASISKLIQERKALPVSAENEYGHNEKSFLI
ncbi:MAG: hypothetical protein IKP71_11470, partial [Candidatus Riflebacteria bacterium]|nr:hypothetical protein [Candidatus Riflebacteria bacterium]